MPNSRASLTVKCIFKVFKGFRQVLDKDSITLFYLFTLHFIQINVQRSSYFGNQGLFFLMELSGLKSEVL
jgi:hypothetical protein